MKDFANRDEVVIATKVHGKMAEGPNVAGLSRKAILREIDKSQERLGTDYVDLSNSIDGVIFHDLEQLHIASGHFNPWSDVYSQIWFSSLDKSPTRGCIP